MHSTRVRFGSDGRSLCVTNQPELPANAILNRLADLRFVLEELLGVLAALTEPLAAEGEPRAALLNDTLVHGEVDEIAGARDTLAIHDVELRLAERRRHLVLDDLHARAAADDDVAVLDAGDPADIETHRRIELERAAAGRRLGITEHHADLLAELIDEDQTGLRLGHHAREFAQRLRHQP